MLKPMLRMILDSLNSSRCTRRSTLQRKLSCSVLFAPPNGEGVFKQPLNSAVKYFSLSTVTLDDAGGSREYLLPTVVIYHSQNLLALITHHTISFCSFCLLLEVINRNHRNGTIGRPLGPANDSEDTIHKVRREIRSAMLCQREV